VGVTIVAGTVVGDMFPTMAWQVRDRPLKLPVLQANFAQSNYLINGGQKPAGPEVPSAMSSNTSASADGRERRGE
jgi:hypothetical protein